MNIPLLSTRTFKHQSTTDCNGGVRFSKTENKNEPMTSHPPWNKQSVAKRKCHLYLRINHLQMFKIRSYKTCPLVRSYIKKCQSYSRRCTSFDVIHYDPILEDLNALWEKRIFRQILSNQMNNCRNFSKLLRQIFPPSSAEIPYIVALNSSNYSIFQNKPDYQRANSSITDANVPSETGHTHRSCCWPKA
jgi:hypothetical protein